MERMEAAAGEEGSDLTNDDKIDAAFAKVDDDDSGEIDFDEFCQMMRTMKQEEDELFAQEEAEDEKAHAKRGSPTHAPMLKQESLGTMISATVGAFDFDERDVKHAKQEIGGSLIISPRKESTSTRRPSSGHKMR